MIGGCYGVVDHRILGVGFRPSIGSLVVGNLIVRWYLIMILKDCSRFMKALIGLCYLYLIIINMVITIGSIKICSSIHISIYTQIRVGFYYFLILYSYSYSYIDII